VNSVNKFRKQEKGGNKGGQQKKILGTKKNMQTYETDQNNRRPRARESKRRYAPSEASHRAALRPNCMLTP